MHHFFCSIDKLLPLSDEKIQLFNPPSLWNRTKPCIPLHLHLFKWRSIGCCRMPPETSSFGINFTAQRRNLGPTPEYNKYISTNLSYKYNIKLNHLKPIFVHIYMLISIVNLKWEYSMKYFLSIYVHWTFVSSFVLLDIPCLEWI